MSANLLSPAPAQASPDAPAAEHSHGTASAVPHLHPEHFTLAAEVARMPLAGKRRRLAAILIDLVVVAALTHVVHSVPLLAGAAVGGLLYWAMGRFVVPAWMQRRLTRAGMALALCGIVVLVVRLLPQPAPDPDDDDELMPTKAKQIKAGVAFEQLGLSPEEWVLLMSAQNVDAARPIAAKLAENVRAGADPQATGELLRSVLDKKRLPIPEAVRSELLRALTPELPAGERAAPSDPRDVALAELRRTNAALEVGTAVMAERVTSLEEQLEDARKDRGILHFLQASAHDLGFGIGWSYVYFIGFVALWNGRTPGKRLVSIRVVRIDGKPMTLWRSWERFHGYAASLLTGFIGFFQVLWDPSRQCLHDKVAETVVVRDPA